MYLNYQKFFDQYPHKACSGLSENITGQEKTPHYDLQRLDQTLEGVCWDYWENRSKKEIEPVGGIEGSGMKRLEERIGCSRRLKMTRAL